MAPPRFSVVIPTRNRAAYLGATIRTVLHQRFSDFELVVSDNGSSPETKRVVDSFSDERIRYYRLDTPLAMADSWDFALSKAQGEYVLVIGSDDGLLPHSLESLDRLFRVSGSLVCRWKYLSYRWPDCPGRPNQMQIPLGRGFRFIPSKRQLRRVLAGRECLTTLPMIYHGAVHRSLLEELRARQGRFLAGAIPDMYSGFAIGYLVKQWVYSEVPHSVNALSGTTNGKDVYPNGRDPEKVPEFFTLNAASGFVCHPSLPDIPANIIHVADSFLRCKERLFPRDSFLSLDRKTLAKECLYQFGQLDCTERQHRAFLDELEKAFPEYDFVRKRIAAARACSETARREAPAPSQAETRCADNFLWLDASRFSVRDVFDAALLAEHLLGYAENGIEWQESAWGRAKQRVKDWLPPSAYRRLLGLYIHLLHWRSRRPARLVWSAPINGKSDKTV